jgi:hypothetical protein
MSSLAGQELTVNAALARLLILPSLKMSGHDTRFCRPFLEKVPSRSFFSVAPQAFIRIVKNMFRLT